MHSSKFSRLSFASSLISSVLVLFLLSRVPSHIGPDEFIPTPPMLLVVCTSLSSLLGFLFALLSFIYQEPSSALKWIGGIVNTFLFVVLAGSITLSFI